MSAKRFSSPGITIVSLAMYLVGGGCASLRPPALETGDAVEAEVVYTVHTRELEGNVPPEPMQTILVTVAQVLEIIAPAIIHP
jgi:hypothetical protein